MKNKIISIERTDYGEKFDEILIRQYEVFANRAGQISEDRNSQSKYLLTIQTAILAIPTLAITSANYPEIIEKSFIINLLFLVLPIIGVVISALWIQWIKTFGEALKATYSALKLIEEHLPAKPFTIEMALRDDAAKGTHRTSIETFVNVSWVILIGNLVVGVIMFLRMLEVIP